MHYRIVVFGNKSTTQHLIEFIHKEVHPIDLVVTVGKEQKDHISGYANISSFSESLGIQVYTAQKYSLTDKKDLSFFKDNTFELGISTGWQRLIPNEVLLQFKKGIFGFHGSVGYLPFGRGRSPLNWSLINGHTRYINHCFQYNPEADKGKIHSIKMFEINQYDTIQTLQYKTLLVSKEQIIELLKDYNRDSIYLHEQHSNPTTWYPKRSPEDGKISLFSTTKQIYDLIRGVTKPFPGAYLLSSDNKKLLIWEAYPFDQIIDTFQYSVGEVIEVFNSEVILKTIDGSLIIKHYEFDHQIEKGNIFH